MTLTSLKYILTLGSAHLLRIKALGGERNKKLWIVRVFLDSRAQGIE
jgi:hypothetical protein